MRAVVTVLALSGLVVADPFRGVVLLDGDRERKPTRIEFMGVPAGFVAEDQRVANAVDASDVLLVVEADKLHAFDWTLGTRRWTVRASAAGQPRMWASATDALFVSWPGHTKLESLSRTDGRRQAVIDAGGELLYVHRDAEGLILVSDLADGRCRVAAHPLGRVEATWALTEPRAAEPWLRRPLVVFGEYLLLCADDEATNLTLAHRSTGKVRWRLPRVWEFERHKELASSNYWSVRRAKPKRKSVIAAGPFIIPWGKTHRIFVGVNRFRTEHTAAQIAEGRIFEINWNGTVETVTDLPRPLVGNSFPWKDGVTWRCAATTYLRTVPSFQDEGGFKAPGTDRVGCIVWYREGTSPARPKWYGRANYGKGPDLVMRGRYAIRLGWMYVVNKAVLFPLVLTDVSTGKDKRMTLSVARGDPDLDSATTRLQSLVVQGTSLVATVRSPDSKRARIAFDFDPP
jgi:hypothetical protein